MHFESFAVETGDPNCPFLARITFGTRNKQDTMYEWGAESLDEAQRQADDWLYEFSARVGLPGSADEDPAAAESRARRLKRYKNLPEFPEPTERTRKPIAPMPKANRSSQPALVRSAPGYPKAASIVRAVKAARKAGIAVAGVKVWPDGAIAAFDATAKVASSEDTGGALEWPDEPI